jgi:hypothetical protein
VTTRAQKAMNRTGHALARARGNAVVLERDPLVRDQVNRLMGVPRQLASARNSPMPHTSRYEAALWLNDVQNYCTIQAPDGRGEELLCIAWVPQKVAWVRRSRNLGARAKSVTGSGGHPSPMSSRGRRCASVAGGRIRYSRRRIRPRSSPVEMGCQRRGRLAVAEGPQCCSCACSRPWDRHRSLLGALAPRRSATTQ